MKYLKITRNPADPSTMSMRRVLVSAVVAGLVGCAGQPVGNPVPTERPTAPPACVYRIFRTSADYFVMLTRATRQGDQYISSISRPGQVVGVVSPDDPKFVCMLVPERLVKI